MEKTLEEKLRENDLSYKTHEERLKDSINRLALIYEDRAKTGKFSSLAPIERVPLNS